MNNYRGCKAWSNSNSRPVRKGGTVCFVIRFLDQQVPFWVGTYLYRFGTVAF